MRILLTLCYDGTDFCGYQIQPNGRTVEEELNIALKKVTGKDVKSVSSGRTDSGVHALSQKVHFDTDATIPPESFAPALNAVLPSDVKVVKSQRVSENLNARYSAKKKTYKYSLYVSDFENPIYSRYKTLIKKMPDVVLMKECAKVIEGTHDFKRFVASGSSVKDTVRTVYSVKVVKKGNFLDVYVTGNGFLYNMVRIIAGAIVAVGEGKLSVLDVKKVVDGEARPTAIKTMPSKGLLLYSVIY